MSQNWKPDVVKIQMNPKFVEKMINCYIDGDRRASLIEFLSQISYESGRTVLEELESLISPGYPFKPTKEPKDA